MTTRKIWLRAILSVLIVLAVLWAMFHVNLQDYAMAEPWIKTIHIISIISLMAGMLYLPRLFVYHCSASAGSETSETFKIMEKRLLRYIINPALVVAWITGLWMAWSSYQFHGAWLHLKFTVVILLSAYHGLLSRAVRKFGEDDNQISAKTWRILNEVPTVLMIIAVIAVIIKPFS